MRTLPDIGARVKYVRRDRPERTVIGTVTALYPSYGHSWICEETGERVYQDDAIAMRVDSIPEWWAYPNSDVFAPDIAEIELIK